MHKNFLINLGLSLLNHISNVYWWLGNIILSHWTLPQSVLHTCTYFIHVSGFSRQQQQLQVVMSIMTKKRRTRQESSMIHSASPQSRPAVIVAWFWSFGTDGQTYTLCENSDHYRSGLWSASWIKKNKITLDIEKVFFRVAEVRKKYWSAW